MRGDGQLSGRMMKRCVDARLGCMLLRCSEFLDARSSTRPPRLSGVDRRPCAAATQRIVV